MSTLRRSCSSRSLFGWLRTLFFLFLLIPLAVGHRCAFLLDNLLFPALGRVRIRRPLFLVGLPRSGTTLCHRLIASQTGQFTTLPLWELVFAPAYCEKIAWHQVYRFDQWLRSWVTDRRGAGPLESLLLSISNWASGTSDAIHPTSLFSAEEDALGLLAFDGCFLRVLIWPHSKNTWDLGYFGTQCAPQKKLALIRAYRHLLQAHLRFRGEHLTILSKNPGFVTWITSLSEEFPDAKFIGLAREPERVVASQLSSIRDGLAWFGHSSEDTSIVRRFLFLLGHYHHCLFEFKQLHASNKYQLLDYSIWKLDPSRHVLAALQALEYEASSEDMRRFQQVAEVESKYRSRHRYSLEEFGLTKEQVESAFRCGPKDVGTRISLSMETQQLKC